jgi:hypothetical protein
MGMRPTAIECGRCGKAVTVGPVGRVPIYCSPTCRVAASEERRGIQPRPMVDERMRATIWHTLQDAGVIPADKPLPPRREDAA